MLQSQTVLDAHPTAGHPLDRLTSAEIDAAREVAIAAGLFGDTVRVAYLGLEEPPKADVISWVPGEPVSRRIRMLLLDMATGAGRDVIVAVHRGAVESVRELDSDVDGQPPIMLEEFMLVDEIVKADPGWRAGDGRAAASPTSTWSVRVRCPLVRSASTARPAGGCCGCSRSCSTTRRTTAGRTRSTASSPTST